MARLVDADELEEKAWRFGLGTREDVVNLIRNAPTVEPKHGHWEVVDETEPRRYGCSVCKRLSWTEDNYCSYCGCKMDEVEEDG